MAREISPGIHWIQELGPDRRDHFEMRDDPPSWYRRGNTVHIPQCAYLLVGSDETLLFDTLSPASTEKLKDEVSDILNDRSLDYVVVSHPDIPHAGNAVEILREYPRAELVGPGYGNDHELYHLDDALQVTEGDAIDLGDLVVEFHEATFLDAPVFVWMTERTTGTLFTVDWMGFPHLSEDELNFVDEVHHDVEADQLLEFHARVLFWHKYVDVEKVQREIDNLIEKYDPSMIAPAHGLVIRKDAVEYMEEMKDVVARIQQTGRLGIIG
ncbi:MBL fold metallo-hydrolase [Halegenticoccus tardaugens]|uniref:MBL fold metallo-hydrolase n=1 Tax=Halegenticoccus tardaugens TaxID=2071624 RepID=UPI00100ADFD7|nr:MBL fold metallo-hydrolase [Halegenticoccus tardaugens]